MLKKTLYFLLGTLFGLLLYNGNAASFYGLTDMFHFRCFQIFGIFLTAVPTAALSIYLIKRYQVKAIGEAPITFQTKTFTKGKIWGSALFGIGWGITGTCPGPIFVQLGAGEFTAVFTLLGALAGTWVYSALKNKLWE